MRWVSPQHKVAVVIAIEGLPAGHRRGEVRLGGPVCGGLWPAWHDSAAVGIQLPDREFGPGAGVAVKGVAGARRGRVRREAGGPESLGSSPTAKGGGYVVEGHVPAADVRRMLAEKPAIRGLSAPGMPLGSPGMEVPGKKDAYDVVAFDKAGKIAVFESHR